MDAKLRRIVKENDLTSIGVNFWTGPNFDGLPVTVYVHWEGGNCKSGNGKTVAEAVERALGEMREVRAAKEEAAP